MDYPHLKYSFGWGESGRYWGWSATHKGLEFGSRSFSRVTKKQMRAHAAEIFAEIMKHCPDGK